jgi:hypothetical protein
VEIRTGQVATKLAQNDDTVIVETIDGATADGDGC